MVYLAGPITPKDGYTVEDNVKSAIDIYFTLIKAGVNCFCPQLGAQYQQAFDIDYERWMAYDKAFLDVCDTVLMLPRWNTSLGALDEKIYATLKGKRIVYDMSELL